MGWAAVDGHAFTSFFDTFFSFNVCICPARQGGFGLVLKKDRALGSRLLGVLHGKLSQYRKCAGCLTLLTQPCLVHAPVKVMTMFDARQPSTDWTLTLRGDITLSRKSTFGALVKSGSAQNTKTTPSRLPSTNPSSAPRFATLGYVPPKCPSSLRLAQATL